MRKIDYLLDEYGQSHRDRTNKLIHWVCVPLIFLSLVALIWSIPHQGLVKYLGVGGDAYFNWATLALFLVFTYYITLSIPLAIGMMLFSLFCLFLTRQMAAFSFAPLWLIALIIFALAWAGQFYGHKVEGKKPSFFKDLQFLLIGPAWLMHFIYKRFGIPY